MITQEIDSTTLEKISSRFNNLMKRHKSTDSEGEAATCLKLAQKMLWQNNLEEAQLLSEEELKRRTKPTFVKDGVKIGYSKYACDNKFNSREWKSELLEVLAKNFFCRLRDGYGEIVTIVGEQKNIDIVKSLYGYVESQIRASRKVAFKQAVENNQIAYAQQNRRTYWSDKPRQLSQFSVNSFKDSFAKGAVSVIAKRLEEQQKENIEEANNQFNERQALNPGANLNEVTHTFGNALVEQIISEVDEAYYELYPDENPITIKLREYERLIAYNKRMAELEVERKEREARIEAGLELPPTPQPPVVYKEYKQRGRKPQYRDTFDRTAYLTGRVAGTSIQINKSIEKGSPLKLNK